METIVMFDKYKELIEKINSLQNRIDNSTSILREVENSLGIENLKIKSNGTN